MCSQLARSGCAAPYQVGILRRGQLCSRSPRCLLFSGRSCGVANSVAAQPAARLFNILRRDKLLLLKSDGLSLLRGSWITFLRSWLQSSKESLLQATQLGWGAASTPMGNSQVDYLYHGEFLTCEERSTRRHCLGSKPRSTHEIFDSLGTPSERRSLWLRLLFFAFFKAQKRPSDGRSSQRVLHFAGPTSVQSSCCRLRSNEP